MRTIIVVSFVYVFCFTAFCQSNKPDTNIIILTSVHTNDSIQSKPKKSLKLKEKDTTHFTFPLQFGVDVGKGYGDDHVGNKNFTSWTAYMDINLSKKILFLTIDCGQILGNMTSDKRSYHPSIGVKWRCFDENKHNIFLHIGFFPFYYTLPYIALSAKYMYALNDFIGVTLGSNYIFHFSINNYFVGFNAGIQIFTN